ncbi:hypothetical protein QV08_01205 [Gallibacterium salpingitidis]|uniref:AAA+ ATPase domain-containing protein n=1 Tax=Gallibacterium salpingitidis TaxID=505341 RepID=A0AB36E2V0_9PAST|nr:ATP-binding protein [Gallibacterium salpingitidis]OBX09586.1 hypothetical protein QV08_01205 [Gallibacterium salpingitidis]OBX10441.1 hypothetical protein QV09_05760 [Gallibacterium salpingitidis]
MTKDELLKTLNDLENKLSVAEEAAKDPFANVVHCQKHGDYRSVKTVFEAPYLNIASETKCPHCLQEEIDQVKARILAHENALIADLKKSAQIPPRFENCHLNNYEVLNDGTKKALMLATRYTEKWLDRLAKGGGLIFCGKPGTGKNHLACAIANEIIEQYQAKVLLSTALRIVRDIKTSWNRDSTKTEDELIKYYAKKDLLIIDEIGVQFGSEAEKIILFEIINTRYENRLPTILISNLSVNELSDYIGERVLDRMMEGQGAIVAFDWESYRK